MKNITILISIAALAIASLLLFSYLNKNDNQNVKSETINNTVYMEGDTQIINVTAYSGGYSPSFVTAEAGKKTILRLESNNSYGCERSFRIPQLNVTKILPQTGITEFDLGIPEKGEKLLGTCSMGMYTININFK